MEFDLVIHRMLIDAETGEVIEQGDTPVGTATVEELHDWYTTGNEKIWNRGEKDQRAS